MLLQNIFIYNIKTIMGDLGEAMVKLNKKTKLIILVITL